MSTPYELRNQKLGAKVVKALQSRRFEAWYVDDPGEAADKALSLIPKTGTVSWGGSATIAALGIRERLVREGYQVLDRDAAKSPEERMAIMRQALLCDTFLTSSNAISEDGQLVNIDGNGNRVAAMIFGPKQIIVVAGMNKVTKTLEDAYPSILTTPENPVGWSFGGKIYWGRFQGSSWLQASPVFIFAAFSNIRVRYFAGFQLFAFAVSISVYNSHELLAPEGEPDITQFFRPITKGRIPRSHALLSGVNCQSSRYRGSDGHIFRNCAKII
jgi:hypothetical protein